MRLRCLARLGHREVWGHTLNVSLLGVHLQLPLRELQGEAPKVGSDISVRLVLPQAPSFCEGTVAWVKLPQGAAADGTVQVGVSLFEVDAGHFFGDLVAAATMRW